MAKLSEMVAFLDHELNIAEINDYPAAMNGLQLQNAGNVGRIIAAVDASLPVIQKAAAGGPGLLVVHHGMFWQGAQPVKGAFYEKLKIAMDAGLAIYSSHLPLDVHPLWGNNMGLGNAIGLREMQPFFDYKGIQLGIRGVWSGSRKHLEKSIESAVGAKVHVCPGGKEEIHEVGIITGGAGSEVMKVAATGVGTFITGEGPHWSYPLAEELGINLFYAGHYATETFGVRSLAAVLSEKFCCRWHFVDHPSGL